MCTIFFKIMLSGTTYLHLLCTIHKLTALTNIIVLSHTILHIFFKTGHERSAGPDIEAIIVHMVDT